MLSHEDRGMSTAHEFDRVALERAGKKEVLKVCPPRTLGSSFKSGD